jgi:alanine dehydrogenase
MPRQTLILSQEGIKRLVDMRQALGIVERVLALHAKGETRMPAKIYIHLDKYQGDFRAMPAYIQGLEACGIKWVNVHPGNNIYRLPAVMAVIIINDPRTGFPLAVMDGTYITNLRTGAAGGVAAKYLANKGSSRIALVGCGQQAQTQLLALSRIFRLKLVSLFDCDPGRSRLFMRQMRLLGLKMNCCRYISDCVSNADIVVTTTPSRSPIVKSEWISPGTHINAIGADAKGKEELDPQILKMARIFVDDWQQARHSGEINVPLAKKIIKESDICGSLGDVIIGETEGRLSREQVTVFDSTGLAILDVAVASYVYKRALRSGLGRPVRLMRAIQ